MEHVSNPVGLLLPMHFIVIMFKMNSPADERTKLKVIYCFKPFVSLICYVILSLNCFWVYRKCLNYFKHFDAKTCVCHRQL